jgi:hypothetical protein
MTEMDKKRDEMISALAKTITDAVDHVGKEALAGDLALLQLVELALEKVTELNERVHTLEKAILILTQRNDATRH